MNLQDAYATALRLNKNIQSAQILVDINAAAANLSASVRWKAAFIPWFEGLDYAERKILKELNVYHTIASIYDDLRA